MEEQRRDDSRILSFSVVRFQGCGGDRERLLKEEFEARGLTRQECRIALMLLNGCTNETIRSELYITRNTLKFHIRNINRKLDVHSHRELLGLSMRLLPRPGRGPDGSGGRIVRLSDAAAFYRQQCGEES